jgi:hypothetical protein
MEMVDLYLDFKTAVIENIPRPDPAYKADYRFIGTHVYFNRS